MSRWFLKAQYGTGGSGGGHTIVDDEGTSLEQRSKLQFKGTYSEDNMTGNVTEVNITRTMTRSEFELLSDDEKKGLINVIDETSGVDGKFQPVIYSEEEHEIGVWTDGKPLYEKTYYSDSPITVSHNSWSGTGITITNVALIAFCSAVAADGSYQSSLLAYISNNELKLQTPRSSQTTVNYVTIRYTKTTDTSGSGKWTPQGVPTIHYSENEVVAGTWINGKTLYARTFVNENLPKNLVNNYDVYTVGIFDINAEMAFFITGALYETGDQRYFTLPYERSYSSTQKVYQELYTDASGKLYIIVSSIRSSGYNFSKAYITAYYTKRS